MFRFADSPKGRARKTVTIACAAPDAQNHMQRVVIMRSGDPRAALMIESEREGLDPDRMAEVHKRLIAIDSYMRQVMRRLIC